MKDFHVGYAARVAQISYWENPHMKTVTQKTIEETMNCQGQWSDGWLSADRDLVPQGRDMLRRLRFTRYSKEELAA